MLKFHRLNKCDVNMVYKTLKFEKMRIVLEIDDTGTVRLVRKDKDDTRSMTLTAALQEFNTFYPKYDLTPSEMQEYGNHWGFEILES